jgi:hypothetical protein
MLLGICIGTIAFCFDAPWAVLVGGFVTALGLITGWALAKLGWGVNGPRYVPKSE